MPQSNQIPQSFAFSVASLTAEAYELGINCPPLGMLNRWLAQQGTAAASGASAGTAGQRNRAGTKGDLTSEILLKQIQTAPAGMTNGELATFFPNLGSRIGPMLAALKRSKSIVKAPDGKWIAAARQEAGTAAQQQEAT